MFGQLPVYISLPVFEKEKRFILLSRFGLVFLSLLKFFFYFFVNPSSPLRLSGIDALLGVN